MMGSFEDKEQANTELYIGHESSGQLKRLTENNIFEGFPVWSADSKQIVFVRGIIRKSNRFYVIDVESMQEKQVPEPNLKIRRGVDWLSDGKHLIVLARANIGTRKDREVSRLAVIHLNKGTARWLTKGGVSIVNPRLSPDRNKIVFVAQSRNPDFNWIRGREFITRVHVLDIDAVQMQPLGDSADEFELDIWPVWAPDGNRIAWIRINVKERTMQVLVYNLETKKLLKIRLPGEIRGPYSLLWSPDSEHLACVTYRQLQNYTLYVVTLNNNSNREVMNTKSQIQCLYWR
jgi:Tol biopolymer transport system component